MCVLVSGVYSMSYLDGRCRPGDGAVHLCTGNHVGNCIKVVHLVHSHGNRGGRKSNRKQGMGHHHEGQVQSYAKKKESWNNHIHLGLFITQIY